MIKQGSKGAPFRPSQTRNFRPSNIRPLRQVAKPGPLFSVLDQSHYRYYHPTISFIAYRGEVNLMQAVGDFMLNCFGLACSFRESQRGCPGRRHSHVLCCLIYITHRTWKEPQCSRIDTPRILKTSVLALECLFRSLCLGGGRGFAIPE